jgi:mediator of RNA polymerase II transcription subunit 5
MTNKYASDLVDTFLLPSLVPALTFLAEYLWVDQKEQMAVIKVLQLILLPSAISHEASAMLASVKKVIAKPLEHALRTYQKRYPKNEDITPLLGSIKDSLPLSRRTGLSDINEVESWAAQVPNGFSSSIRMTIQLLAQWGSQWSLQPNVIPAPYVHRQIIAGLKVMTTRRTLQAILDEVRSQTEQCKSQGVPPGSIQPEDLRIQAVYDVAVALICAPNVTNEPPTPSIEDHGADGPPPDMLPTMTSRPMSLREALRLKAHDFQSIQKTDAEMAEIVVRLHRRVEAQMTIAQAPPLLVQAPDMTTLDMANMGDIGDAGDLSLGEAMAAMQTDVSGAGGGATGNGLLEMPVMDSLGSVAGGGMMGTDSTGDDMFGGLDGASLDDFDWGTGDMNMDIDMDLT